MKRNATLHKRLVGTALLALLVPVSAFAQFNYSPVPVTAAAGAQVDVGGTIMVLKVGDEIELPGGFRMTIGEESKLVSGTQIKVNGKKGTVKANPSSFSFNAYFAAFSIAGPIPQEDSSLKGGTKTVYGQLITVDKTLAFYKGERSFTLGGWYFHPDKAGSDLYQIHARYHFDRGLAAQFAILDSTKTSARSASYHLIYKFSSEYFDPNSPTGWTAELGIGALNNFTGTTDIVSGLETERSSLNFSTFAQFGVSLTKDLHLNLGYWFVRDRNVDINRFAVGFSVKF